jgi:hypothetical protein
VAAAGRQAAGLADNRADVGLVSVDAAEPLDGDGVAGWEVARLGHDAVRALAEHLQLLVVADAPERVPRALLVGRRGGWLVGRPPLPRRCCGHEVSCSYSRRIWRLFEAREREIGEGSEILEQQDSMGRGQGAVFEAGWTVDPRLARIRRRWRSNWRGRYAGLFRGAAQHRLGYLSRMVIPLRVCEYLTYGHEYEDIFLLTADICT